MSVRPPGLHSRSIRPGRVFHTSAYVCGIDLLNTAYNYLDPASPRAVTPGVMP
jgi:hypothetical protein